MQHSRAPVRPTAAWLHLRHLRPPPPTQRKATASATLAARFGPTRNRGRTQVSFALSLLLPVSVGQRGLLHVRALTPVALVGIRLSSGSSSCVARAKGKRGHVAAAGESVAFTGN